jgi:ribonuclease VapC
VVEVRYGTAGLRLLARFRDRAEIECVPVDLRHAQVVA